MNTDNDHSYIAIDLKSFYASVECVDRNLDPLTTNLVVADASRTDKTICLAVSPGLKRFGVPGRPRLFEVKQRVKEINAERKRKAPYRMLTGTSWKADELLEQPELAVDYLIAVPRMKRYMEISTQIYRIYLQYISPDDIHIYSIDEVFMDVTHYRNMYQISARELAQRMIRDVMEETGITATVGIGTNLYLAKVAMDIVAKHMKADENGVRIAELDEYRYRRLLWDHQPLTDFWRISRGYAKRLDEVGIHTMGEIAKCALGQPSDFYKEELLYDIFGVNAELLIDHAWGYEPCSMSAIKKYKPASNSLSSGQVLRCAYSVDQARLVMWEMADKLSLDLAEKGLVTDQLVMTVGYDIENLKADIPYHGKVHLDHYGRKVPEHAHGTQNLEVQTASTRMITEAAMRLYDRIVNQGLLIRRLNLTANHIILEAEIQKEVCFTQMNLFTDYQVQTEEDRMKEKQLNKEKKLQKALLEIKHRYGKNAVLRGNNFLEGATMSERNEQVGGHRA